MWANTKTLPAYTQSGGLEKLRVFIWSFGGWGCPGDLTREGLIIIRKGLRRNNCSRQFFKHNLV